MIKTERYCPLIKKDIDDADCYDFSMWAERIGSIYAIPEEIDSTKLDREICLKCEYHPT